MYCMYNVDGQILHDCTTTSSKVVRKPAFLNKVSWPSQVIEQNLIWKPMSRCPGGACNFILPGSGNAYDLYMCIMNDYIYHWPGWQRMALIMRDVILADVMTGGKLRSHHACCCVLSIT